MLRLAELRRRAVDLRARVDQLARIELVAAVVALVAPRLREAADRAGALDIPVGKRVARDGGERDEHLLLDDRAVRVERGEQILRDALVVERGRSREQVVGETQPPKVLAERLVVVVGDLTVRPPFSIRGDHHRRAVLVRAAHHEDVVPFQPVIAGEDVRRDSEARHVAQVAMSRCIRPGRSHEDLPRCARHPRQSYERVSGRPFAGPRREGRRGRGPAGGRRASGARSRRLLPGWPPDRRRVTPVVPPPGR